MISKREFFQNKKASQPFDFKFLGNLDVSQIINNLNTFTEEQWEAHAHRNADFRAHNQTNSLEILWDKDSLKTGLIGKKNQVNYKQLDFDYIKNIMVLDILFVYYFPVYNLEVLYLNTKIMESL